MTTPQEPEYEVAGEIRVASRIVDLLSSGLYENPADCLKELVNNSYDADATKVALFVRPTAQQIIIEDNGHGMSREEFEQHFGLIADSTKRDESQLSPSGRPLIGRIGIGFVAANEICDVMEIFSTQRGSGDLLHVFVDFKKMREDPAHRRRQGSELAKGDYYGWVDEADKEEHFTRIFLREIRGEAAEMLLSAERASLEASPRSLFGLLPDSVAKQLRSGVKSWSDFDEYSEAMLRIALNVPVAYHDEWHPPDADGFEWFTAGAEANEFDVAYDGTALRKPVALDPQLSHISETFQLQLPNGSARGYLYAQHGVLRPQDINGVLIRVRGAAVGEYDASFLGFPTSQETLFQRWCTGEIWIDDDSFEAAVNIDRRSFRTTHETYRDLERQFHEVFGTFLKSARSKLYGTRAATKRAGRVKTAREDLSAAIEAATASIPARKVKDLIAAWETLAPDREATLLLKKYGPADILSIVIESAEKTLDEPHRTRFLTEFNKRLAGG